MEIDNGIITHKTEDNFAARKQRDKRNQSITYLTADQASAAALNRDYLSTTMNAIYLGNQFTGPRIKRNADGHKGYHLSEMTSLDPDGTRYVYGIPAYNNKQVEATFNVYHKGGTNDGSCLNGQVTYTSPADNSVNNKNGSDHFFTRTSIPPYAHSYLLTSVLSPDYVDVQA